jgi:drug/metabolite transporter (DMT)-like permease
MTYFYLVLTAFFWATVFHLGKYAVAYMSPLSVAAWRFLVAGAVLLGYLYVQKGWDTAAVRRNIWPIIAMGVIGVFGFNVALFFGLQHTSSVNAALIMAFYPAMTAIMSALLGGGKILPRQLLGFAISLTGVSIIVSQGSLHNLLTLSFSAGDLLMLLGCACFALYGVIPQRFISNVPSLLLTTSTIVVGALMLAIAAAVAADDLFVMPRVSVAATITAMALFGSVLAYLWWNQGVARLGATRAAIFINLVPVFTSLIGVALGQSLSVSQLLGAMLVIAGVITTMTAVNRPTAEPLVARAAGTNQ